MITISPTVTVVSAILIVVVLIIAFNLRGKIKKTDRGNEFLPWERDAAQGNGPLEIEEDEEENREEDDEAEEDENEED